MALAAIARRETTAFTQGARLGVFLLLIPLALWLASRPLLTAADPVPPWTGVSDIAASTVPLALLAAVLFGTDLVSRDRDSRMIVVLKSSIPRPWTIVAGKLVAGMAVFGYLAVEVLVVGLMLGAFVGWVALRILAVFVLGPLLLTYLSLVGPAVLVSVTARSSRAAFAVAVVTVLALESATVAGGLLGLDALTSLGAMNPLVLGLESAEALGGRGQVPWHRLALAGGVGFLCVVAAGLIFQWQEEAA